MNKVITIADAKGGVTKTTTSIYLAAAAKLRTPDLQVRVMDADPQSSAARWSLAAMRDGNPLPFPVEDAKLMSVEQLGTDGFDGLTIVDTPPAGPITVAAIQAADFVVVPITDSELDLQQAWSTLRAIQGRPAAILVCRAEERTVACRSVLEALEVQGTPRFDTIVRKRQQIKTSMGAAPAKLYEYSEAYDELMEAIS